MFSLFKQLDAFKFKKQISKFKTQVGEIMQGRWSAFYVLRNRVIQLY